MRKADSNLATFAGMFALLVFLIFMFGQLAMGNPSEGCQKFMAKYDAILNQDPGNLLSGISAFWTIVSINFSDCAVVPPILYVIIIFSMLVAMAVYILPFVGSG